VINPRFLLVVGFLAAGAASIPAQRPSYTQASNAWVAMFDQLGSLTGEALARECESCVDRSVGIEEALHNGHFDSNERRRPHPADQVRKILVSLDRTYEKADRRDRWILARLFARLGESFYENVPAYSWCGTGQDEVLRYQVRRIIDGELSQDPDLHLRFLYDPNPVVVEAALHAGNPITRSGSDGC
jgi:hypothetical protein